MTMKKICIYTLPMSREELAALEKDIKAELAALQAEGRRLDFDWEEIEALDDEIEALDKDIAVLVAELATVRAEKRRAQHDPPSLTQEKQEISHLETKIAALQEEIHLGRQAMAGAPHLEKDIKRLTGEMLVLIVKKNLLKRTPRPRELKKELGRTPANDEVGSRMNTPAEKVQEPETVSLDSLVGRCLIEDCWDSSSVDEEIEPADEEIAPDVRDEAAGILKTLSPREEQVVRMRFGIGCDRVYTLEEIGQKFDLTRERIRQIEAEALGHLRAPERARRLRALMAARWI